MVGGDFSWVEQYAPELRDLILCFKRSRGESGTDTPWGQVLVITGAGCSASAGIPTARQIAQECAVNLSVTYGFARSAEELGATLGVQAEAAVVRLVKKGELPKTFLAGQGASEPPWSELYEYLFTHTYDSPTEQKRVIERALAREQGLNWAHACLGELMRHRYVHTVLTVNFDLLALEGAVRAGVIPAIADGFEGLSRVDGAPAHPQLVYLHGTRHNYTLRNAAYQVNESAVNPAAIRAVGDLVRRSACILVVGYSAADSGLAELLRQSLLNYGGRLVWTAFDPRKEKLSAKAREMCKSPGAKLLLGVSADGLFRELLRGIGLGAPQWIWDPLNALSEAAERLLHGEDASVRSVVEVLRGRIAQYRDQMKSERDPLVVQLGMAEQLRLAGQELEAIETLRELRNSHPNSPEVLRALGNALVAAGKVRAESALLTEAVVTFKECLELFPREADENAWAQAQARLGYALVNLGDLEEGAALVEEAVAAYREAFEVHTREQSPLDWAKDQNDLGTALRTLADLEEGTARLKEAVEAFRTALEVRTRERCPLDWATTQHNLGEALTCLGEREGGTACLEEAVKALRTALEVRTREGTPFAWARTQHYLGAALRSLGEREEGTARLEEAVVACRAALEVRSREQVPLYWARSQNKLGRALAALGEREEGTERLEEAVVAYREVLEVRSREGPKRDWALTQCNLGDVLIALGNREEGTAWLEEAIAAFRAVLELPEPLSTVYTARARSGVARAEFALRARQVKS